LSSPAEQSEAEKPAFFSSGSSTRNFPSVGFSKHKSQGAAMVQFTGFTEKSVDKQDRKSPPGAPFKPTLSEVEVRVVLTGSSDCYRFALKKNLPEKYSAPTEQENTKLEY
jgi:hypothetical protein